MKTSEPLHPPEDQPVEQAQLSESNELTQPDQTVPGSLEKFSMDSAFSAGLNGLRSYFWPFTGILTSTWLLTFGPGLCAFMLSFLKTSFESMLLGVLVWLVSSSLKMLIELGLINVQLLALEGKPVATRDIFSKKRLLFKFVGGWVIEKLLVLLGYVCLILPGIYLQIALQFWGFFVVERSMGPIQAIKASLSTTRDCWFNLFVFSVITGFINWIGGLFFIIGALPAYIITGLAKAHVYTQLVSRSPQLADVVKEDIGSRIITDA